jgi:predicted esterase
VSKRILLTALLFIAACGGSATQPLGGSDAGALEADATPLDAVASPDASAAPPDAGAPMTDAGGMESLDAGASDAALPCSGQAGTYSNQSFDVQGTMRHYWLHVPPSYTCDQAWPLIVDFHGTGVAAPDAMPEEFYGTDELIATADAEKFIVVRPRSLSASFDAQNALFQWDVNPGDLGRNVTMAHALVALISSQYAIDPIRIYAMGFSNGTNMSVQFLADDPPVFHGIGLMEGGLWSMIHPPAFTADAPRIYATTGWRDYIHDTLENLESFLVAHHYPSDRLWVRETDSGHEIYGWQFKEAFGFVDRGERPMIGSAVAPWTVESFPEPESLLKLAAGQSGEILGSGTGGKLWRRDPSGHWTRTATLATMGRAPAMTSLCVTPSGQGAAVGQGALALTSDFGRSWRLGAQVPEFGSMNFGYSYLVSVACGSDRIVGGGYWAAAVTMDGGAHWSQASMPEMFADTSQVASVTRSEAGTWLALGYYDYVGRSTDGVMYDPIATPIQPQWWTSAASANGGRWWIVGEEGSVLFSSNDGLSFSAQSSDTSEDLYAVGFADEMHGLAVGNHGAAIYTADGGLTWRRQPTGLDLYLGDVVWIDPMTALVAGERGTVLRFTRP